MSWRMVKHQAAMQVCELPVDVDGATNAVATDEFFAHTRLTDEFFAHMKACEELMLDARARKDAALQRPLANPRQEVRR